MKNVVPEPLPQTYPHVEMNRCQLYLARNKVNNRYVTAVLVNKEVLIIGTGGLAYVDNHNKCAADKFQESYYVIRSLSSGEKVTMEV